ncbi:FAD:protein FMN transferase [Novosphingobium panipatense]
MGRSGNRRAHARRDSSGEGTIGLPPSRLRGRLAAPAAARWPAPRPSGIAKGFAVDALAALLQDHGYGHALVEIGGELVGRGLRPDGDPWWVDLETPSNMAAPLRVALHQLAVATSGDYVRGHHTIDPRSGAPVEHAMAVSVIHSSAMWADAWATALSVHAPASMRTLAVREGLRVRALTRSGATVEEWISPALEDMLVREDASQGAARSR